TVSAGRRGGSGSADQLPRLCSGDCGRDAAAPAGRCDHRGAEAHRGSGRRHGGARAPDGGREEWSPAGPRTPCGHGQQDAGRPLRSRGSATGYQRGHFAQLIMARKAFLLRIDSKLLSALERWAAEELRSLNGQIEYLLRQSLAKRGTKVPAQEEDGDEER